MLVAQSFRFPNAGFGVNESEPVDYLAVIDSLHPVLGTEDDSSSSLPSTEQLSFGKRESSFLSQKLFLPVSPTVL